MPLKDREARLAYQRDWCKRNPEKIRAKNAKWEREHPDELRAKRKRRDVILKARVDARRTSLFEAQGFKCAVCGTLDPGTSHGWHLDHDHSCCPGASTKSCGKCDRGGSLLQVQRQSYRNARKQQRPSLYIIRVLGME